MVVALPTDAPAPCESCTPEDSPILCRHGVENPSRVLSLASWPIPLPRDICVRAPRPRIPHPSLLRRRSRGHALTSRTTRRVDGRVGSPRDAAHRPSQQRACTDRADGCKLGRGDGVDTKLARRELHGHRAARDGQNGRARVRRRRPGGRGSSLRQKASSDQK